MHSSIFSFFNCFLLQTLVYENYSRFIEATDAIRSIGVNVEANKAALETLIGSMNSVSEISRNIEESLGDLRDRTAEKIRVQRLLTRLDTLLKLPTTLQQQINQGKYKTAATSYLSVASVLAKHSQGFESLKTIETECNIILQTLQRDLYHKLLHWSGREIPAFASMESVSDDDVSIPNGEEASNAIDPPNSIKEIYECAGALYILLQRQQDSSNSDIPSSEDLFSMTVAASMRLLERMLDTHLIDIQERDYAPDMVDLQSPIKSSVATQTSNDGIVLIPHAYLDVLLEGATLYGANFIPHDGDYRYDKDTQKSSDGVFYLLEFVAEAFTSFMSHVRNILLEESAQAHRDDADELTYKKISSALSMLVLHVRNLASSLTLLRVGITDENASKLVDQVLELTESMVRRRVDRKFYDLRISISKDCLVQFAARAVAAKEKVSNEEKEALPSIIHIASSTLSDCLQLVDDTIRSILSEGTSVTESIEDLPDLKSAVHVSTYQFANWLANAFEMLAGEESTDSRCIADAPFEEDESFNDENTDEMDFPARSGSTALDLSAGNDLQIFEFLGQAKEILQSGNEGCLHPDFLLSIFELCRLSEASVPENLEQSLSAHLGGSKKKNKIMFPTSAPADNNRRDDDEISKRFRIAASRVLVLYVNDRATFVSNVYVKYLLDMAGNVSDETQLHPSSSALAVLSTAKKIALECARVFGEPSRGGPVPEWEENILSDITSSTALSRKSGLLLDVERIFKEKVLIYPHPSETVNNTRNAVLFLFFKIIFRWNFENARLCLFSASGYQQMLIDNLLLQHMIPHYINLEYSEKSLNCCTCLKRLLDEVVEVIGDRCNDESIVQSDAVRHGARDIVRDFLISLDGSSVAEQFVIRENKNRS